MISAMFLRILRLASPHPEYTGGRAGAVTPVADYRRLDQRAAHGQITGSPPDDPLYGHAAREDLHHVQPGRVEAPGGFVAPGPGMP
jgi:hypothetical protein